MDDWTYNVEKRGRYMRHTGRSASPKREAEGAWQWVWGGSSWSWAWVPHAQGKQPSPQRRTASRTKSSNHVPSRIRSPSFYRQHQPPPPPTYSQPPFPSTSSYQYGTEYDHVPAYARSHTTMAPYLSRLAQRPYARSASPYAASHSHSSVYEDPRRRASDHRLGHAVMDTTQAELIKLRERIQMLEQAQQGAPAGLTEDELIEDVDEVSFGRGISLVAETIKADDITVVAGADSLAIHDAFNHELIFDVGYEQMFKVLFQSNRVVIDTGEFYGPVYLVPAQITQGVTMARVIATRAGLPCPCPASPRRSRSRSRSPVQARRAMDTDEEVLRAVDTVQNMMHRLSPETGSPPSGTPDPMYSPVHPGARLPPPPVAGDWTQAVWREVEKEMVPPIATPTDRGSPYQAHSPPPVHAAQPPPPAGAPPPESVAAAKKVPFGMKDPRKADAIASYYGKIPTATDSGGGRPAPCEVSFEAPAVKRATVQSPPAVGSASPKPKEPAADLEPAIKPAVPAPPKAPASPPAPPKAPAAPSPPAAPASPPAPPKAPAAPAPPKAPAAPAPPAAPASPPAPPAAPASPPAPPKAPAAPGPPPPPAAPGPPKAPAAPGPPPPPAAPKAPAAPGPPKAPAAPGPPQAPAAPGPPKAPAAPGPPKAPAAPGPPKAPAAPGPPKAPAAPGPPPAPGPPKAPAAPGPPKAPAAPGPPPAPGPPKAPAAPGPPKAPPAPGSPKAPAAPAPPKPPAAPKAPGAPLPPKAPLPPPR
ncbi:hypothetical protein DIPPA_00063 [Diplonema papillatum]|nr:hypothetical protein DIPPA_00063 [Diplonema papillatum]